MSHDDIKPQDHPDFVGGWLWTKLEIRWIKQRIAEAVAAEREALRPRLEQCEALARSVMTNKMGCDCKRHGFYAGSVDDICPLCAERIQARGQA